MAIPYQLHELAHEEYIAAYEWYELKQMGLGDKFMFSVEQSLIQVSANPEYYSILRGRFRQATVKNFPFVIVYEFFPKPAFIHIASIFHVKRNPTNKYRKK